MTISLSKRKKRRERDDTMCVENKLVVDCHLHFLTRMKECQLLMNNRLHCDLLAFLFFGTNFTLVTVKRCFFLQHTHTHNYVYEGNFNCFTHSLHDCIQLDLSCSLINSMQYVFRDNCYGTCSFHIHSGGEVFFCFCVVSY